jgi:cytoskeletal protein CcmA (bactofilin family)
MFYYIKKTRRIVMKKLTAVLTIVLILFLGLVSVSAQNSRLDAGTIEIEYNEENDDITSSGIFLNDYFAAGENLFFSGNADDLYLFGKRINYEGRSKGGMIAFAESIEIKGIVSKNLHSAAKSIRVSGNINETAFLAARNIVVGKEAVVGGTLISASKNLHIIGKLENGLIAAAGEIIIDGPVSGNVDIRAGKLIITERGLIDGNLSYSSSMKISEIEKGQITGTVNYKVKKANGENAIDKKDIIIFFITAAAFFFLSICVTGLLLLLLPGIKSLFEKEEKNIAYLKTLLWGLLPLFIYPVAVIITLPLLPLSIALILALFPLLGLTIILGLTLGGKFLFKTFKWKSKNVYLQFLFAFALFMVLSLIPFVNILTFIAVSAMGAGIILSKLFKTRF